MRVRPLITGLVAALLLPACRSTRPVAAKPRDLHPLPATELAAILASKAVQPRSMGAKADISFATATEKRSFKAHLRLVCDSALWVSITPALGIEVARVLLTPDSLKIIDKLHDQYWAGDTAQARARFGMQPGLKLLQEALLGLPIGLDAEEKYRSGREDGMYTLASREKRKFIRAAEDIAPGDTLPGDRDMREKRLERTLRKAEKRDLMVYKYWIEPDSMALGRVLVSDLGRDQQADVRYMDRKAVSGYSIPARVALSLSAPGQLVQGTLELDRIQLNEPLSLPFRIPEKFTPMGQ